MPEGAVVQINLVNGDGATHDLSVPEFNVKSNQVNDKGASTSIVFKADKKGVFTYICTLPGHVAAGMIGKIVVGGAVAAPCPACCAMAGDKAAVPRTSVRRACEMIVLFMIFSPSYVWCDLHRLTLSKSYIWSASYKIDSHQKIRKGPALFVHSGNFDVDHVPNMHLESKIFHAPTF